MESFLQLIGVLLILVFVLAITYFTTRWMAGIQKGRTNNKNLKILESIGVGNGNLVSIIQAGETYLVVAIGKDKVSLLTQLDEEQLMDISFKDGNYSSGSGESFQKILARFKDK